MADIDIQATLDQLEAIARTCGIGKMEIYRRLGVNASTYTRWRKGELTPSLQSYQRIGRLIIELGG